MAREVTEGVLGAEFDRADRLEVQTRVKDAESAAKDEVWAAYRSVVLGDSREEQGLKTIDLGAGHSSASETLCGRIVGALKAEALLNESRRRGLYRPPLATRVQRYRGLAAHEPAPELSRRLANAADRSRRDPSPTDRWFRGARGLRAGVRSHERRRLRTAVARPSRSALKKWRLRRVSSC